MVLFGFDGVVVVVIVVGICGFDLYFYEGEYLFIELVVFGYEVVGIIVEVGL